MIRMLLAALLVIGFIDFCRGSRGSGFDCLFGFLGFSSGVLLGTLLRGFLLIKLSLTVLNLILGLHAPQVSKGITFSIFNNRSMHSILSILGFFSLFSLFVSFLIGFSPLCVDLQFLVVHSSLVFVHRFNSLGGCIGVNHSRWRYRWWPKLVRQFSCTTVLLKQLISRNPVLLHQVKLARL